MTNTYEFKVVPKALLGPGNSNDPFRFYSDMSPPPAVPYSQAELTLQVQDLDNNRQIDAKDRFVWVDSQGSKSLLNSSEALKLLNYFADPELLKSKDLGVHVTRSQEATLLESSQPGHLEVIPNFSEEELDEIKDLHFPFWEVDGHLDLNIMEGIRIFTEAENERWTGAGGIGIFWNGRYFVKRVLGEKGAIAVSFIAVEHVTRAPFVWQMYTSNFFSMIAGSFSRNNQSEGIIQAGALHSDGPTTSHETRRMINIETAKARANLSKDHLYWSITGPIVTLACFADPDFRKFWPAPWRLPRLGLVFNYFANQFNRATPFMGRSPLGFTTAALSGLAIYEMSSHWFDVYGHMPQGSTENRVFSLGSTLLTQAALYSNAAREMEVLTGASTLTLDNVLKMRKLSLVLRPSIHGSRLNLFGIKIPFFKGTMMAEWTESVTVKSLLERYGSKGLATTEVAVATEEGMVASNILARRELVRKLASGEILVAERAGLSVATRLLNPATEEELMMAENILLRSRMKSVGLPLLGAAALIGLGVGIAYATGIFSDD